MNRRSRLGYGALTYTIYYWTFKLLTCVNLFNQQSAYYVGLSLHAHFHSCLLWITPFIMFYITFRKLSRVYSVSTLFEFIITTYLAFIGVLFCFIYWSTDMFKCLCCLVIVINLMMDKEIMIYKLLLYIGYIYIYIYILLRVALRLLLQAYRNMLHELTQNKW